jgi:hypothetical protein
MTGSGVIRRLAAANATRPEKRSGPSASREVARIESDAALTDSTLDRLLQPVGSTHPTGYARYRIAARAIIAAAKTIAPGRRIRYLGVV